MAGVQLGDLPADLLLHVVKAARQLADLVLACQGQAVVGAALRERLRSAHHRLQRLGDQARHTRGQQHAHGAEHQQYLEDAAAQRQHLALHGGQWLRQAHHHEPVLVRAPDRHAHERKHAGLFVVGARLAENGLLALAADQIGCGGKDLLHQDALPPVEPEGQTGKDRQSKAQSDI